MVRVAADARNHDGRVIEFSSRLNCWARSPRRISFQALPSRGSVFPEANYAAMRQGVQIFIINGESRLVNHFPHRFGIVVGKTPVFPGHFLGLVGILDKRLAAMLENRHHVCEVLRNYCLLQMDENSKGPDKIICFMTDPGEIGAVVLEKHQIGFWKFNFRTSNISLT